MSVFRFLGQEHLSHLVRSGEKVSLALKFCNTVSTLSGFENFSAEQTVPES